MVKCIAIGACDSDGEIRLVGGRYSNEGRLELCRNEVWGTVCNENWDITDARVACAELSQDPEANITGIAIYYVMSIHIHFFHPEV